VIRFSKYAVIGILAFGLNVLTLWTLTSPIGLFYLISAILTFFVVEGFQYLANNYITFGDRKAKKHHYSVFKYLIAIGFYNLVYLGLLAFFTEVFGIYYLVSSVMAICLATLPKYTIFYFWVWPIYTPKILLIKINNIIEKLNPL